jgi:hypothetical protein
MLIKKPRDVLQVVISDTHSGSNYALFLDRVWRGRQTSHDPSSKQIEIRKHFNEFGAYVRERRKGKRVILVHNGDAIDGDHHNSGDVCSRSTDEQADIHIEIMTSLQTAIGWQAGDKLYYTRGTKIHVEAKEDYIGNELNAVMDGDRWAWEVLQLETNGVLSWFLHHGPKKGKGANRGNGLRNWMRNIYYECLEDNQRPPDIIYTGHVHDPDFAVYAMRNHGHFSFRLMQGVILPSWQMKTVYAYEKAPVSRNRIGGVVHEIKADGVVGIPEFFIMGNDGREL